MPLDTLESIESKLSQLCAAVADVDKRLTDLKHASAEWLSPAEVAEYLGVSLSTVKGPLRKALPWVQVIGTKRLIVARREIDALMSRNAQNQNDDQAPVLDSVDDIARLAKARKGKAC